MVHALASEPYPEHSSSSSTVCVAWSGIRSRTLLANVTLPQERFEEQMRGRGVYNAEANVNLAAYRCDCASLPESVYWLPSILELLGPEDCQILEVRQEQMLRSADKIDSIISACGEVTLFMGPIPQFNKKDYVRFIRKLKDNYCIKLSACSLFGRNADIT